MRLKGKRAIVTGAASGIGLAITERFVAEGAAVAACDINGPGCKTVVERLRGQGHRIIACIGDITKSEDTRRMVAEAVAFLGGLDILVNNAGIDTKGTVLTADDETWDRQLSVNVSGIFRMSKYAIPEIIKAGGGSVVNIGSIAGFLGYKNLAAYGASKGAVVQLTRNMAADFAEQNVRVNSINPGVVDTPLLEHACKDMAGPGGDWEAIKRAYVEGQLIQRPAKPSEIAAAVLFFASDDSTFCTGAALLVDGGYSIQQ